MLTEKQARAPSIRQRVRLIHTFTADQFSGVYKGCEINIDREPDDVEGPLRNSFAITVRAQDGGYLYDGWWRPTDHRTMSDAVMEALYGSRLVQRAAEEAGDG